MSNSDKTPKRVGVWIRVSTDDQVEGESPEHHEARARMYAKAKDWTVVEVYQLDAVSGKSVMGQPETERMMADIRRGHITGLVFSKLARLARNTKELLDFAEFFESQGADLISLQESIDTSTPAGRFFYTLIAAMAQWEREEISERVAASVPVRAKLGKPLGGAAPFGYQWKDGDLVPDPDEAPIRREMYALFLQERRINTVARKLNDAGHRTRRGAKFSFTTVLRLLQDPTAKGVRRANYTRSLGEGKHWELKPEEEWVHVPVEAIVSQETWDECNQILQARRKNKKRRPTKRVVHLFAGLTVCEDCGTKMYVLSNSPKYTCQDCRMKIPADDLEAVFREQLHALSLGPDELSQALAGASEEIDRKKQLLQSLQREQARVSRDMEKVYRLYLDEQISSEGFGSRYRPLEERQQQLSEEIPRLQGELDFLTIQRITQDEVLAEADDLYRRWPDLIFEEKRRIVSSIVDGITVGREEIGIDLIALPFGKSATKGHHNLTGSSKPPG